MNQLKVLSNWVCEFKVYFKVQTGQGQVLVLEIRRGSWTLSYKDSRGDHMSLVSCSWYLGGVILDLTFWD